jgi:glycosyltransferase involved in cell wall biosynthesis
MKRIVHIITGLSTGGAEMMLLRLVEQLRGEFEQKVISLTGNGSVGEKIAALGVPVVALGLRRTFPNPLAAVRLVGHITRFRPVVVQTWMYHADLVGGLSARIAGVPKVVWNLRASDLETQKPLTRMIQRQINGRLARRLPDVIVCCGEGVRSVHMAAGYPAGKMRVISNGVDVRRFSPNPAARQALRAVLGVPIDAPLIGTVGRLHPMKDYGTFFAAAHRLSKGLPRARFVLAGEGLSADEAQVAQWVEEAGLAGCVHLLGQRDDVSALYNTLDVFVSSSTSEGFPNVLIEAMACGVPCVATDVGDSALIVGKTGRIVPPRAPEALADAVTQLLLLPAVERTRLGLEACERVRQKFSIESIGEQYANLYRALCASQ